MNILTESKLVDWGIGIKTDTYFKCILYVQVAEYEVMYLAVFGVN